jgi:hypothetical protein
VLREEGTIAWAQSIAHRGPIAPPTSIIENPSYVLSFCLIREIKQIQELSYVLGMVHPVGIVFGQIV